MSLLDEKPKIVASAGSDFGIYKDYLDSLDINTSGIEIQQEVTTASAYIINDQHNNQISGFFMGAMGVETTFYLQEMDPKETILILAPGNKGDMLRYSQQARDMGMKYIFDPGQSIPFMEPAEIKKVLDGAYILIVNDYELEMIKKRTGLTEEDILHQVEMLIVTRGKEGSTIRLKDVSIDIPACPVENAVDPTGAGDAYRAGLIKGIAMELDLEQVGKVAATAAAYAVEHYGTQEHNFTVSDFCTRYKDAFSETCPIQ